LRKKPLIEHLIDRTGNASRDRAVERRFPGSPARTSTKTVSQRNAHMSAFGHSAGLFAPAANFRFPPFPDKLGSLQLSDGAAYHMRSSIVGAVGDE
jgi:hypothetical protein